jgi:hypothetical protein
MESWQQSIPRALIEVENPSTPASRWAAALWVKQQSQIYAIQGVNRETRKDLECRLLYALEDLGTEVNAESEDAFASCLTQWGGKNSDFIPYALQKHAYSLACRSHPYILGCEDTPVWISRRWLMSIGYFFLHQTSKEVQKETLKALQADPLLFAWVAEAWRKSGPQIPDLTEALSCWTVLQAAPGTRVKLGLGLWRQLQEEDRFFEDIQQTEDPAGWLLLLVENVDHPWLDRALVQLTKLDPAACLEALDFLVRISYRRGEKPTRWKKYVEHLTFSLETKLQRSARRFYLGCGWEPHPDW